MARSNWWPALQQRVQELLLVNCLAAVFRMCAQKAKGLCTWPMQLWFYSTTVAFDAPSDCGICLNARQRAIELPCQNPIAASWAAAVDVTAFGGVDSPGACLLLRPVPARLVVARCVCALCIVYHCLYLIDSGALYAAGTLLPVLAVVCKEHLFSGCRVKSEAPQAAALVPFLSFTILDNSLQIAQKHWHTRKRRRQCIQLDPASRSALFSCRAVTTAQIYSNHNA